MNIWNSERTSTIFRYHLTLKFSNKYLMVVYNFDIGFKVVLTFFAQNIMNDNKKLTTQIIKTGNMN